MSVPALRPAKAAAAALVAALSAAVALPTAAHADTHPRPDIVTVSTPTRALTWGGSAEAVTITVTNTADYMGGFGPEVEAWGINGYQLTTIPKVSFKPLKAPATGYFESVRNGRLYAMFYPAGWPHTLFQIPPHSRMSWTMWISLPKTAKPVSADFKVAVLDWWSVNGGSSTTFHVQPASVRPSISLATTAARVCPWQPFRLVGRTGHVPAGTRLTLEQWRDGRWYRLPAVTTVRRDGGFTLWAELGRRGADRLRVVGDGTASDAVTVTVA